MRSGATVVRAVVVDDWAVLRSGVVSVLEQVGVQVTLQTADIATACRAVDRLGSDLVVLGVLAGATPEGSLAAVRNATPDAAVLMLLADRSRTDALQLLDEGAAGVVARDASESVLRDAVMRVVRGEHFVDPGVLGLAKRRPAAPAEPETLTEREVSVLRELAEGHSNREIADALFIGESTVKTHLHRIYLKLSVSNRVQAVGRARELRLIGS